MIENVKEVKDKKHFECRCEKCSTSFERILEFNKTFETVTVGNIKKAFCDDCILIFREWLKDKGYLETDCWCKHIEEFKIKKEVKA